jgi:hypothetical protein
MALILISFLHMVSKQLELMMRRAADLPEEAQAELARSIAERLYQVEDDERA